MQVQLSNIIKSVAVMATFLIYTPTFADEIPTSSQEKIMPVPKVIIFDVNETLLSLEPLKVSVGEALDGRDDLLPLWFSTMLHYSLVETLSGSYHSFGEIGAAALVMVAETQGIEMTLEDAREAIIPPLRSLPAHADVLGGLTALREDGRFQLVTLTNSNDAGVSSQLTKAGLFELFDQVYTIESLKKYKPHPDTYAKVLDDLQLKPEEVMMVAAHAWDLAGAANVGLQTVFVARPGKTLYPNITAPDYVVEDLNQLVDILQATP